MRSASVFCVVLSGCGDCGFEPVEECFGTDCASSMPSRDGGIDTEADIVRDAGTVRDAGAAIDAGVASDAGVVAPWELEDAGCDERLVTLPFKATSMWVAGRAGGYGTVDFVLGSERHPLAPWPLTDSFDVSANGSILARGAPPNFISAGVFFVADDSDSTPVPLLGFAMYPRARCPSSLGSGRIVFSSYLPKKMAGAFEFDCVDAGSDTHVHACFLPELP